MPKRQISCFASRRSLTNQRPFVKSLPFRPIWGSPPTNPPDTHAMSPVIDLKSLWRSLRSVHHRRWGPPEHKPRDLARAAAPQSRSSQRFPQSWGRIVRPEPKEPCTVLNLPFSACSSTCLVPLFTPPWGTPPNGPGPRLRHCHSSPQGASPRKIAVFFGEIGRQSVQSPCFLQGKVSRIGDGSPEDRGFGGPPQRSPGTPGPARQQPRN